MIIQVIQMVLPVIVSIVIGWVCNRKKIFAENGIDALKAVITKITLPVVLFKAFFTAQYNGRVLLVLIVLISACAIAMFVGYLIRSFVGKYSKFTPFLMTGFEAGMLGYALFGMLMGQESLSTFAIVDIGQTIFVYTVFLALLKSTGGEKATVKGLVKNMLTTPPFVGILLGIILGAIGVGDAVMSSPLGGVFSELMNFIAAPTACLILIIVGYQLTLKRELIRPVLITALSRLVVMAGLLTVSAFAVFRFIPFDKELLFAMMVMFSLPAPFIAPLFVDVQDDGEYISTTYSVSTLITIVCFVAIAAYGM